MKFKKYLSLLLALVIVLGAAAPAFATGEGQDTFTLMDSGSLDFTITSAYAGVNWDTYGQYKGNIHTHSTASDGVETQAVMIKAYYNKGYDVLAMTDHSTLSPEWYKAPTGPKGPITITIGALADIHDITEQQVIAKGFDPDAPIATMRELNAVYAAFGAPPFSSEHLDDPLQDEFFCGKPTTTLTEAEYNDIINGNNISGGIDRGGRKMTQVMYGNEQNFISGNHVNTYYVNDVLPGMGGKHTGLEKAIKFAHDNGGLSQINHPGRYTGSPANPSDEVVSMYTNLFMKYDSCIGFEIINKADSHGNDRILWDRVLMKAAPQGRNIHCFGNDDAHKLTDVGRAWNMMLMPENTPENVRAALEAGASYTSTRIAKAEGVNLSGSTASTPIITKIAVDEAADTITINATDYTSVEWIADGTIIQTDAVNGTNSSTLNLRDYASQIGFYVRAQLKGAGGISFTQPFVLSREGLELMVPENWELEVGDSRTLDYVFADPAVTTRKLEWVSSNGNATVDKWGRVTAVSTGTAQITAIQRDTGLADTVTLNIVTASTKGASHGAVVNYAGTAVPEVENLQKIVTRWTKAEAQASADVPDDVKAAITTPSTAPVTTADGATWTIKSYGVLREDANALTARDEEMRFMGDRYFHYSGTATGTAYPTVLSILSDGENGIWTITASGVTHIAMVEMTATQKAIQMSNTSQELVSRRGMVSEANWNGSAWVPAETDNDGLWTAMYGAGELFRYASLKQELAANPFSTELQQMVADAKAVATKSVEAVLLLSNISMRQGTTQANIHYMGDIDVSFPVGPQYPVFAETYKDMPSYVLKAGGDYSVSVPSGSPYEYSFFTPNREIKPFVSADWIDIRGNANPPALEKQTRLLEGWWARTYSLKNEPSDAGNGALSSSGRIYYEVNGDGTATGRSASQGVVNGENLKGMTVDASGEIPARLKALIGTHPVTDIIYKGDTSMDEVIGHLFIYKTAYDILGPEDPELAGIISSTMERFAQHLTDNSYMMVDAAGQPSTWGKVSREYFYSYRWGAPAGPMNSSVLLCALKVAAYVTGNQKWENEYRMAAKTAPYEYKELMKIYEERGEEFLNIFAAQLLVPLGITQPIYNILQDEEANFLTRSFAQYSDEEMAMLAFYLLFQLEKDSALLADYREALDFWWESSYQYSENPLWYYIYQLANPGKTITDYYGNNILETAAWSLSRHPVDTRLWNASNTARDDIMNFNMQDYGGNNLKTRGGVSIKKTTLPPNPGNPTTGTMIAVGVLLVGGITTGQYNLQSLGLPISGTLDIEYAVAAPDERAMHKYNNSSYKLDDGNNPNQMEGSTTYTLPYWMGVYHGMLDPLPATEFVNPPVGPPVDPDTNPTPASEIFTDVPANSWFHDAVTYVVDKGLFNGVTATLFAPDSEMTRGMAATVLYRLSGSPAYAGTSPYTDVKAGLYYSTPIAWADANKLINGYGNNLFGPEDFITREQLAAIVYRYAKFAGYDISAKTSLSAFTDAAQVSDYAREPIEWAVANGLIQGKGAGILDPRGLTNRAEVAMLFMRLDAKFGK